MLIENDKVKKINYRGLLTQGLAGPEQGLRTMDIRLLTLPPGIESPVDMSQFGAASRLECTVSVPLLDCLERLMRCLLCALLILASVASRAAEIRGKVTNAVGGEALGQVEVSVLGTS